MGNVADFKLSGSPFYVVTGNKVNVAIIERHWHVLQWNNEEIQLLFEQELLVSSGHTSNMAEGSASSSEAVRVEVEVTGDDIPRVILRVPFKHHTVPTVLRD